MSKLVRYYKEGQVYFVTVVTRDRTPLIVEHFDVFWEAVERSRDRTRFEIQAWVVLPEHFHMIIDPGKNDLSGMLRRIKLSFDNQFYRRQDCDGGSLRQGRFWDHIVRDQADMNRHVDYIHYNPVKHGHTTNPFAWRYSSLAECHQKDYYTKDWGVREILKFDDEYGE